MDHRQTISTMQLLLIALSRTFVLARTERQFLFAMHNAKGPVVGDTYWIGPCRAIGEIAKMPPGMHRFMELPGNRDQSAQLLGILTQH